MARRALGLRARGDRRLPFEINGRPRQNPAYKPTRLIHPDNLSDKMSRQSSPCDSETPLTRNAYSNGSVEQLLQLVKQQTGF